MSAIADIPSPQPAPTERGGGQTGGMQMTAPTSQIAMLEGAGRDAFDVFFRNRHIGVIVGANSGKARCYFDMNASRGSKRMFPTAQSAVAYLLDRREKRIAKRLYGEAA